MYQSSRNRLSILKDKDFARLHYGRILRHNRINEMMLKITIENRTCFHLINNLNI